MLSIDRSATLYFENFDLSNYEALLLPGANMQCDLSPPVTEQQPWKCVQVGGSLSERRQRHLPHVGRRGEETNWKKIKLSYLDAAALCARGGSRLPTLSELQAAAAAPSAVTAAGTGSDLGADGEPASATKGGDQGTGTFPLRPMNILDLWNWKDGTSISTSSCSSTCPDTTNMDQDGLKVWTYNGKQATFTSGGTTLGDNVWGNSSAASNVSEVTGRINKQDTLPVLCRRRRVRDRPGLAMTMPASYTQKISRPTRGYSTIVS